MSMDKIYSRKRICLPKLERFGYQAKTPIPKKQKWKIIKISSIIFIAIVTAKLMIESISPMLDKQCINMAKSIATKVSNEQATAVMAKYKYDDLCSITKDTNGNITMISANIIPINEIISDIAVKIQEELNKTENETFGIKMGSMTGSRLFSGRGPTIEIKMSTIGNLDTDLKSEFSSAGINQTLHKMYLQVECQVAVLTPFHTIEEKITNQVLLEEVVIVGTTPNTYYNFEGISKENVLEVIE